ncbi:MAG: hypothetical protein H5U40_01920 [Polyangiaceae bacterium]|nr:hypothetical protein [Polyangiaceae bacterium]
MVRFPTFNRFLKVLLSLLTAAYVLLVIAESWAGVPVVGLLALRPGEPGFWTLWQVFTYPFIFHPGPNGVGSFLITLLFTYLVYGDFQASFGTRRAVQLAVLVTLVCAGATLIVAPLTGSRELLHGFDVISWGALACVAWLARHRPISLFGAIPLKGGEQLLMLLAGLALLFFLVSKSVVGVVSQLAALGAGVLFARLMSQGFGTPRRGPSKKKGGGKRFDVIPGGKSGNGQHWLN